MVDKFNLKRFIDAQANSYERALAEIKLGRKMSHWMWYIFPQYKGLGTSSNSLKYSIQSTEEAYCYMTHHLLGHHLIEITNAFLTIENKTASKILGKTDALKMQSSMTLFAAVQNETDVFDAVLEKYFEGIKCSYTLNAVKNENMKNNKLV